MTAPLDGVRILDFTQATAGPYGASLLADFGAEIIKIETPASQLRDIIGVLDSTVTGGYDFKVNKISTHFLTLNRNKKSVVINMRTEAGRQVFYKLVAVSDVVYDNYRADTPKAMGIDYDAVSKINPRIISCSITGYGATGPLASKGGYDPVMQAMGGGMSITVSNDGSPVRPGIPLADNTGGMFATMGILAALMAREKTGRGQKVDVSILSGQISLMHYMVTDFFASGESWGPSAIGKRLDSCRHWYKCKNGEWIATTPIRTRDKDWFVNYCEALGLERLLQDSRFSDDAKRSVNRDALLAILEENYLTKTALEWEKILQDYDVPCSRVNTIVATEIAPVPATSSV